jgi:RimJ/RimL family protein N-acetyltransferase
MLAAQPRAISGDCILHLPQSFIFISSIRAEVAMGGDVATVRRILSDEFNLFRSMRLEALRAEPSSFASTLQDWQALSDEEWQSRMNDPVFVAFREDEPVGMMGLMRQRASKMTHRATLVMVYVREKMRGTGVATRLLNAVIDHAKDAGIVQLELAVNAENPAAIRFYKREKFSQIGIIPGGFMHEGREIDEIMMARRLAP